MKFWNRLFSKNSKKSVEMHNEISNVQNSMNENMESIFVDRQAPLEQEIGMAIGTNKLSTFLNADYSQEGYRDGYHYHSSDMLANKCRSFMSEFRFIVDIQIALVNEEICDLLGDLIDSEEISIKTAKRIKVVIDSKKLIISQLEKEKRNSAEEEGLVMKVINTYRENFVKGYEVYQAEKFFGGNTGMFN